MGQFNHPNVIKLIGVVTNSKCIDFLSHFYYHYSLELVQLRTGALLIGETVNKSQDQIKCWFLVRGENRSSRRKTSWSRVENQQTA